MVRINLKSKLEENASTQLSFQTKWFLIGLLKYSLIYSDVKMKPILLPQSYLRDHDFKKFEFASTKFSAILAKWF